MCRVCKDRVNVQERVSAHDFHEQMSEFYGLDIKEPKKIRITKKSIIGKIEYQLNIMENNSIKNNEFISQLNKLIEKPIENLKETKASFKNIMENYYIQRIREEITNARESR